MKNILHFNFYLQLIIILAVAPLSALAQLTDNIVLEKDIIYGNSGGTDLKLDLARPVEGKGPFPAVLCFHGGGWQAGNKTDMNKWIRMFAGAGYVGVTVEYRFTPTYKWPAQVEDAKAAVRFIRRNAARWNIDPDHIGVMGESAGGYLALMAGLTDSGDSLDGTGNNQEVSSRVQAVVSYFSATDFNLRGGKRSEEADAEAAKYYKKSMAQVMIDFFGSPNPMEEHLRKMSPVTYVSKGDPPVLIFQGDADPYVSVAQAEQLDAALKSARVPHKLVIVKGGGHGRKDELKESTDQKMMAFFRRTL